MLSSPLLVQPVSLSVIIGFSMNICLPVVIGFSMNISLSMNIGSHMSVGLSMNICTPVNHWRPVKLSTTPMMPGDLYTNHVCSNSDYDPNPSNGYGSHCSGSDDIPAAHREYNHVV